MLSPEAIKTRTFATLRQMSLRGSQRQPLILAVEDLHWIDQTSEACFASLVESLTGAPMPPGTEKLRLHTSQRPMLCSRPCRYQSTPPAPSSVPKNSALSGLRHKLNL